MTTTQARPTSRPDPWERQPRETDPAFEAFRTYRDMGASRSLSKVARQLGKSETLIHRWSSEHSWVVRVHAYDANLDREHIIEIRELRRRAAKRNATAAALAMQKFGEVVMGIDTEKVKVADMAAVARVALQMEQDALRPAVGAGAGPGAAGGGTGAADAATIAGMSDEERRARLSMLVREASSRLEDTDTIHDGLHDADDPEEDDDD